MFLMVNVSMNWGGILGLFLFLFWIPASISACYELDWLVRRPSENKKRSSGIILLLLTLVGRVILLPLISGILIYQGWRLDPLLMVGTVILVFCLVTEIIRSISTNYQQNRLLTQAENDISTLSQAYKLRKEDKVWYWSVAHSVVPFASIYYAFSRRTITPLLWQTAAQFAFGFLFVGLISVVQLNPNNGVLTIIGVLIGVLSARRGIKQARSFAKRKNITS